VYVCAFSFSFFFFFLNHIHLLSRGGAVGWGCLWDGIVLKCISICIFYNSKKLIKTDMREKKGLSDDS